MDTDDLYFEVEATLKSDQRADEGTKESQRLALERQKFRHVGRLRHVAANAGEQVGQVGVCETSLRPVQDDVCGSRHSLGETGRRVRVRSEEVNTSL